MHNKIELRKQLSEIRSNITDRKNKECAVLSKLLDIVNVSGKSIDGNYIDIFTYVSFSFELDTHALIGLLFAKPFVRLAVPHTQNKIMTPKRLLSYKDLTTDKFGNLLSAELSYAVTPEITIVPMLGFNENRYRLGYGGGYYDRFLKDYKGVSIGVAFDEQFYPDLPLDEFDVPLDFIITPQRIYSGKEIVGEAIGRP